MVRKGCIFMNHREQHCKCNECSCCCTKKIISTVLGCLKAHFNEIVHFIVLALLSFYVFKNWKTCISMQFFSRFDGNNILFLVWIILIFLLIYKVDGSFLKLTEKKIEETQHNLNEADMKYQLDTRLKSVQDHTFIDNQGDDNHGLSN